MSSSVRVNGHNGKKEMIGLALLSVMILSLQKSPQSQASSSTFWTPKGAIPADGIGEIADVDFDAGGRIYIADKSQATTHILDKHLRVIGSVGRRGSGPGEYRKLHAIRVIGPDQFATLEQGLARIYTYRWVRGIPQLQRTIRIPFEPHDFCPGSGGSFIVYGEHAGKRIHEIDSLGNIRSSAAPLEPVSPLLASFVIDGRIACSQDHRLIIVTPENLLKFEVFAGKRVADLALVRVDSIWPARGITITARKRSMSFESPPNGYHSPNRAFIAADGFIVTAHVLGRGDRKRDDSVRVFEFSLKAPGVKKRSNTIGPLFPLWANAYLVRRGGSHPNFRVVSKLPDL